MKIILSFDVEGDFHRYIHSPYIWHKTKKTKIGVEYSYSPSKFNAFKNYLKWMLVNKTRGWARGKQGMKNIIYFLQKSNIPASVNLCGYLYTKKQVRIPISMPWARGKLQKDKYYWQLNDENFHFSDILQSSGILKNKKIDFGIHGFIHEAFPLEDKKTMDIILKKSIGAGKKLGIKIKTFVPPFNMLFNKNSKQVLEIMKKNGISCVRCVGEDNYLKDFKHETSIRPVEKRGGVKIVYLSESLEGTDSKKKISALIEKIKKNYNKNAVFCIMCHDYSLQKLDNLFILLREIKKIEKDYPLEFTNLGRI